MKYTITVAEISIAKFVSFVIAKDSFVYSLDFSNAWSFLASELSIALPILTVSRIGSLKFGDIFLLAVDAETVLTTDETFNYDAVTQLLTFRLTNGQNPYVAGLSQLIVGDIQLTYWTNKEFDPVLSGVLMSNTLSYVPQIAINKDLALSGNQAYSPIAIKIANNNGAFDNFTKNNIISGNLLKVYSYFGDSPPTLLSEMIPYGVGYISKVSIGNSFSISAQDSRKNLNQILPTRKINTTLFPYVKQSKAESYIPQPWGKPSKCPLLCVNSDDPVTPTLYKFLVADISKLNIDSVTKIYIDGVESGTSIIPSIDTSNGIYCIEIAATAFASDSEIDKVTADISGYVDSTDTVIENALDILKLWLTFYCDLDYSNNFFDIDAWTVARNKAFKVGCYLTKPQKVKDLIPFINKSIFGFFRWLSNNKVSYLITDFETLPVMLITKEYVLNYYDTEIEELYEETYREAIVGWNKDWSKDEYSYFTSEEAVDLDEKLTPIYIKEHYNTNKTADNLNTWLTDKNEVNQFYADLMTQIGFTPEKVAIELVYTNEYVALDIGQIIQIELNRVGWIQAEIIYIKPELRNLKIFVTLRILKYIANPLEEAVGALPYYGAANYNSTYYTGE